MQELKQSQFVSGKTKLAFEDASGKTHIGIFEQKRDKRGRYIGGPCVRVSKYVSYGMSACHNLRPATKWQCKRLALYSMLGQL